MQIICPECKFAREVDESKIPPRSQVATCPKCQTKFKFREIPEQEFVIEEPEAPTTAPVTSLQEPNISQKTETSEQTFPDLPAPGEKPKEDLWKQLDAMAPPEPKATSENGSDTSNKPPSAEPYAHPNETEPVDGWNGEFNADFPEPLDEPKIIYPSGQTPQSDEQQPVDGWNGQFSEDFPDPMQAESDEDETSESSMEVPPPFEQLDRYGFFGGLFMTIKLALFSPRLFFSVMPVGGGLSKPLTFAILVAMIQALAQFAWGVAGLTPSIDITSNGLEVVAYNTTNGLFELLVTPAFAAMSIYFITGFYHLILKLFRAGSKGFEGSFRAVAYAYAPMITGIIPLVTLEVVSVWMLLNAIWGLVLTAIGLKYIHKISYVIIIPVILMPLLIGMILAVIGMQGQMPTM
nr:zinc-ribbon domain-containing protein [uncultured Pseudodesulfovibrio sp.]